MSSIDNERLERIRDMANAAFSERYQQIIIHEAPYFIKPDGLVFKATPLRWGAEGTFVIDYANSVEEAFCNLLEDGDPTDVSCFETDEQVVSALLEEVEWESADTPDLAVAEFAKEKGMHICPVCGKYVFDVWRSFDICDICSWVDDAIPSDNPDYRGGANKMSLNEARIAYQEGRFVE